MVGTVFCGSPVISAEPLSLPGFGISGSSQLVMSGIRIDNSAGDALGHNTDGFDVGSSTDVQIVAAWVHTQDDCLAINSGSGIVFTGGTCVGPTHGLSIGSVGGRSNNIVRNVTISASTVSGGDNGIRIKTVKGATGSVSGVTFSNIVLSDIQNFGIVVAQD